jgi:hypothetical protein
MSLFKRVGVWWYKFYFAGQLIRETSKSTSKTAAKDSERERRRELEAGYNNVKEVRQNRIRSLEEIICEYLIGYRLRYSLTARAKKSRSPHMFLAFMFTRNGALRDTEIKTLTWVRSTWLLRLSRSGEQRAKPVKGVPTPPQLSAVE